MGQITMFGEEARKIVSGLRFNDLKADDSALGDFAAVCRFLFVAEPSA